MTITAMKTAPKRRFLAPEVVQTSEMDCGPASLKCLLEGFHISASYGRLREACQTDVDGTSIDTVEGIAGLLGLRAEQIMVPPDHVLLPEAGALPALAVVLNPDGSTHFVVVWRRLGPFVQVMDPAVGRRWLRTETFVGDLYRHTFPLPALAWREWADGDGYSAPLLARLRGLGIDADASTRLISSARSDAGWQSVAALDAATRMVEDLVRAGGLRRGHGPERLIRELTEQAAAIDRHPGGAPSKIEEATSQAPPPTLAAAAIIPEGYWTVRPTTPDEDGAERLALHGAVLMHVAGRRDTDEAAELPRELRAALSEPAPRPAHELWRLIRADGLLSPAVLFGALMLASAGVFAEALLFRGLFEVGQELGLARQRFAAAGVLVVFLVILLLLERPIFDGTLRVGRQLELRLRTRFLEKLPRLGDRYLQSRPISDMAERSHSLHYLRQLPMLGAQVIRVGFELALTTAGIIWLDPASAPIALAAAAIALLWPLLTQPVLAERDLRMRTHMGGLGRFYLDALLGLTAVRTHAAEPAVRREHAGLLAEWARAAMRLNRTAVTAEAGQLVTGFGLVGLLLHGHLGRVEETGAALLIVYWALYIPVLGQEAATLLRQFPLLRNTTLRLLEPLGTPEETDHSEAAASAVEDRPLHPTSTGSPSRSGANHHSGAAIAETSAPSPDPSEHALEQPASSGVEIAMEGVAVRAGGHMILDGIELHIPAGQHVAIVGRSGAGKSSLVGLLLGWHRASEGRVLLDRRPLDRSALDDLRRETAWVDPSVQLWNAPFINNLTYGGGSAEVGEALEDADLYSVLETMPDGLQTRLGESGRRVSGGEGQRIRLGRALLRRDVRLVLLDEPFRGLDGTRRRRLLGRARARWRDATMICVTHDIADTTDFERIVVIENGSIVEDGSPSELLRRRGSRYCELLEQERHVREVLWSDGGWRRLHLLDGELTEAPAPEVVDLTPAAGNRSEAAAHLSMVAESHEGGLDTGDVNAPMRLRRIAFPSAPGTRLNSADATTEHPWTDRREEDLHASL